MSISISGLAFPLNVINANGWGVPRSEVNNAIESLKSSVVRICTRAEAHICDYSEDPYSEIGHITDAWEQDGGIYAKGIITDSAAEAKITEGTWGKNWSVFAYEQGNIDGFSQGFQARSMTLVQFPAWESSKWDIAAAAAKGDKNKIGRSVPSIFEIITASTKTACNKHKKGDKVADPTEAEKIIELEKKLAESAKALSDLQEAVKTSNEAVTAANKAQEKVITEQKAVIASLQKDKAGAVPLDKIPEMISAALKEDKEEVKRAAAYDRLAAAMKANNVETSPEETASLSAATLEKFAEQWETKLKASNDPNYPAAHTGGADTGIFNPNAGGWPK